MARVQVEGGARLRRTLRQAGVDMKEMRDANRAAARSILPIAISMAPVGQPRPMHWESAHPPGQLKNSLRVAATNKSGMIRAGRKSVPYGGPIHWGWPARNISENPWVLRAAQDNEDVWTSVYHDEVDDILKQIKGK